jgi:hypothetical protein
MRRDDKTRIRLERQEYPNISRRNNLIGQKMTRWKLSSLLSTQTNQLYYTGNIERRKEVFKRKS